VPFSHFTSEQITPLIIGISLLMMAIFFYQKNSKLGLGFLFLGALAMAYFMANLDPYLAVWDEQFHAMVAKNLSQDFLNPRLYAETPAPFDITNWSKNSVWLHKQPLFLWQMAASIKIFGVSTMAVRLPSIILFSLIPLMIYKIGSITMNKSVGFYGGLLFAVCYFPLELVAGAVHTDHNDLSFLFYVTASFWAWFEYQNSGKKYWLILIGVFSGAAVLTKWLMGLIVYVIWFITEFITNTEKRWKIRTYFPIIYAQLISVLIFIPWQIYIFVKYPIFAQHEFNYNGKHFFEVVEGHGGPFLYHFQQGVDYLYGSGSGAIFDKFALAPFFLFLGLFSILFKVEKRKYIIFMLGAVAFVYLFFSFAQTKMPAFTLIVMPFMLLGFGTIIDTVWELFKEKYANKELRKLVLILLLTIPMYSLMNLDRIELYHTDRHPYKEHGRKAFMRNMAFIHEIKQLELDESNIIFNAQVCYRGEIPIMFFTGITTYMDLPEQKTIARLKTQNRKICVVNLGNLPEYILNDPEITILTPPIK
jgi:4-amino-4-deoxy-L-arabinose transferase